MITRLMMYENHSRVSSNRGSSFHLAASNIVYTVDINSSFIIRCNIFIVQIEIKTISTSFVMTHFELRKIAVGERFLRRNFITHLGWISLRCSQLVDFLTNSLTFFLGVNRCLRVCGRH